MQNISEVFIVDVSEILKYRPIKYCICVSVLESKYLFINTEHREMYYDFEINASDYAFLNSQNRFVSCLKIRQINSNKLKKKVGNLNRNDMMKIVDKIQKSETLDKTEKDSILNEITNWISNSNNQVKDTKP